MPVIVVTSSASDAAERYVAAIESRGGEVRLLTPDVGMSAPEALEGIGGLLLSGGPDIDPSHYDHPREPSTGRSNKPRDRMELALVREALERDMPVLGICRGMQLLNVAFGGWLLQDIPGHRGEVQPGGERESAEHSVYVSPGSKLAAVIGAGAVYRKVNSRHHQGLRIAQMAPALLASAYMPEDGVVEGLESPRHEWVIGVQCHPEREDEVPRAFLKLFDGLLEWAERFIAQGAALHTGRSA